MCTAITYQTKDHYFGRNLDYEISFGERIVVTPRNHVMSYKKVKAPAKQYAMIGMALISEGYPLYFDAINEEGLGIAGLHFVGNAYYEEAQCKEAQQEEVRRKTCEIAPYELIPWVLSQCKNIDQVKELLTRTRLVAIPFSETLALSPLHFMIADKNNSIVVEPVREGLKVYDNPVGVLTNNPPFPFHIANLNNYMNLTADVPKNRFCESIPLQVYSRGMGAIGLPGDTSSMSRFVRAAFIRANAVSGASEEESISQFFHILGSVMQQRGCVRLEKDLYEITIYSSCCNLDRGIYYYRTYENSQVCAVDMHRENLDGKDLISYAVASEMKIRLQNEERVRRFG